MATPSVLVGLLALLNPVNSMTLLPRSITPPAGCPIPTWTVNNFRLFNGSNSLDCVHNAEDINTKGCLCPGSGGWCAPNQATCNGSWVNVCYTGMPNYTPWGYGPPETLDIDFADGLDCHDEYIGYRIHDIGNGDSNCGYQDRALGRIVSFYGSSNQAKSVAHMDYVLGAGHALKCDNGSTITYSGSVDFPLTCTYDAQANATCTAPVFDIPVLSYQWVS